MSRRKKAVTTGNRSTLEKALDGCSSALLLAGVVVLLVGGLNGMIAGILMMILGAGIAILGNSRAAEK